MSKVPSICWSIVLPMSLWTSRHPGKEDESRIEPHRHSNAKAWSYKDCKCYQELCTCTHLGEQLVSIAYSVVQVCHLVKRETSEGKWMNKCVQEEIHTYTLLMRAVHWHTKEHFKLQRVQLYTFTCRVLKHHLTSCSDCRDVLTALSWISTWAHSNHTEDKVTRHINC